MQQVCKSEGCNDVAAIATAQPEAVVRRLLDADPALRELEVLRAGLAEAFTELTRETAAEQEAA